MLIIADIRLDCGVENENERIRDRIHIHTQKDGPYRPHERINESEKSYIEKIGHYEHFFLAPFFYCERG